MSHNNVFTKVELEDVRVKYSTLFCGHRFDSNAAIRYGCLIEDKSGALKDAGLRPSKRNTNGYSVSSLYKPLINVTSRPRHVSILTDTELYMLLKQAFDIADARNLGRDALFNGVACGALVEVYEYTNSFGEGVAASLLNLVVDPRDLLERATCYSDAGYAQDVKVVKGEKS